MRAGDVGGLAAQQPQGRPGCLGGVGQTAEPARGWFPILEMWAPAEALDEFNAIVGPIQVVYGFR
jgi:hypothetical protein